MAKRSELISKLWAGWFRISSIGMTLWILMFTTPTFIGEKLGYQLNYSYNDLAFVNRYMWATLLLYFGMGVVGLIAGFLSHVSLQHPQD